MNGFPADVECQVEDDLDRIDEILYRRHTGSQGGIGQSSWDASAKSIFVRRTGKKTKVNIAEEIEGKLKEGEFLTEEVKVPRSNLNRLLSSEGFRNRVGISLQKNHLEITHDEQKVLNALTRIAKDLASKEVTLEDVWASKGKKEYLDLLETEGVLPTAHDSLTTNKNFKTLKPVKKPAENPSPEPEPNPTDPAPKPIKRKTLVRSDIDYGIIPQAHTQRVTDIWNELQHALVFGKHDNAIAVLFRVLLEFAIGNYVDRKSLANVYEGEKLANRFNKVLDHMLQEGAIDKKYAEGLRKFGQVEALLSANTMNKYIHHENFFPSDHHLKSMWDTMADYVVICMKA